ncbi:MAG: glycosyltransferase family 2 protein [Chloroflexales bacterium]|nr:glycosyltransferase family 2 protein [Chloroflexales bacterium]
MLVSVVIPTKSRPQAVYDAVRSVFLGEYQNFELFVIDQSPDDSTRDALATFMSDPRFSYFVNRRRGYGAASSRNVGIAASSGEVIAVIDDDVEVKPDWMGRIVAEFSADPKLMFITGTLLAPPYDPDKGFTPAFTPYVGLSNWLLPWRVSGANISMRRKLFDQIGGYDEFCGPGSRLRASDDGDITFRMMRSGAKWKPCPDIVVVHTHGFRPGKVGRDLQLRYEYGNGGLFGRFTRRGDIVAGLFFFARELRKDGLVGLNLIRGRRPSGFAAMSMRLRGFWHGFWLSPKEGFVSGPDLRRLGKKLKRSLKEAKADI